MTTEEHLLVCLAEECAEVIHEIGKILRFGMNDNHPSEKNIIKNEQRLNNEINDVMGVVEMLQEEGVKIDIDEDRVAAKKQKILKYMAYARVKNTLK